MAECAQETRNAFPESDTCPQDTDGVMFVTATGYLRRRWTKFIECVAAAVNRVFLPDDEDITINGDWAGRTYYDLPELQGKRFRLFRNGLLLAKSKWRPLNSGGFELLTPGDKLLLNQVFTIVRY